MALTISENNSKEFGINQEFIEQGKIIKKSKKRGGPYPKGLQDKRKDEGYKLHFEYGYSERRIAQMMSINRGTVRSDLDFLYRQVMEKNDLVDPEINTAVFLERLDIQRARIRKELEQAKTVQEKIILEKMIFSIDDKIVQTYLKLCTSERSVFDKSVKAVNQLMKDNNRGLRYMTFDSKAKVSQKASQKIEHVISEDRKQNRRF